MQNKSSGHALHSIGYHLIWCPRYSHPVLVGAIEVELKRILAEICVAYEWELQALEIMPDHVHIFLQADHLAAPVDIVKTLKSISAVQLFNKFPKLKARKFWGSGLWSKGTYYASVGHICEDAVKRYIETHKDRD
jgi:putative transposase